MIKFLFGQRKCELTVLVADCKQGRGEAKAKVIFPSTSVAKDQWFNIARNKIIAGNGQR